MSNLPVKSTFTNAHTLSIGDVKVYDVYRLIHLTSHIEPEEIETTSLVAQGILKEECWSDDTGKLFSPAQLLDAYERLGSWEKVLLEHPGWSNHVRRVRDADYNFPILMYRGESADGTHRIIKAFTEGARAIKARRLDTLPEEAVYKGSMFEHL